MEAAGIQTYEYVTGIGSSPARVNRRTGHLQINTDRWHTLKPEHKLFILLHEEGHVRLNSSNEMEVDEYAANEYMKRGYSLKESVSALTDVLDPNNKSHVARAAAQLQRALIFDKKNQQNMNQYDSLFGIGKKNKAARQAKKADKQAFRKEKRSIKLEKKRTAVDNKKARGERIRSKNDQRSVLAAQGLSSGGMVAQGVGGFLETVTENIGSLTGGNAAGAIGEMFNNIPGSTESNATFSQANAGTPFTTRDEGNTATSTNGNDEQPYTPGGVDLGFSLNTKAPKKNNTMIYIGAAVVVVVIVVALLLKKK